MVAPLLAVLGMTLGGAGLGKKLTQMKMAAENAQKVAEDLRQRELYSGSVRRAQAAVDPMAGGDSMQRFGLSMMEDQATSAAGQSILSNAMQAATSQAGQNVTMRGQDMSAEQANASLQQQIAQMNAQAAQQQRAQSVEREGRLQTVRNDIQPLVAPLVKASGLMRSALNAPEGFAGDSMLIRNFAQQLNPVGVLSDSDVAAVGNDPSIPQVIANIVSKVTEGKLLTPQERGRIRQAAAGLYQQNRDAAMTMANPVLQTSDRLGFPRNEIFDESAIMKDDVLQPFLDYQGADAPGAPAPGTPAKDTRMAWQIPGPDGKLPDSPELRALYDIYVKKEKAAGR